MELNLFKKNMCVILTRGRFANRKAIVVNTNADEKRVTVIGIENYKSKNNKLKLFIKKMNPMHLIATSFMTELPINTDDIKLNSPATKKESIKKLESVFISKKEEEPWLFKKLVL
ncbi:60S ribosomal protein L27-3 [Dictyocoela muelleri]|nr:60S ribosomal protein L27-3 [Dictyocoela muelleri]